MDILTDILMLIIIIILAKRLYDLEQLYIALSKLNDGYVKYISNLLEDIKNAGN